MDWGPALLHNPLLKWWVPLALTMALLWIDAHIESLGARARRAAVALVLLTVAAFGGLCVARAAGNVVAPPTWDMGCFWLFGKVAASGADFYQPAAFHAVAGALPPSEAPFAGDAEFREEVLDVGFPYPPPSILLVTPIGHLTLRTASLWWNVIQLLALAGVITLLWHLFFPARGWLGLALVAALVLTFRATYATVKFGQTNFTVLLLVLVFWRAQASRHGGAALALAALGKPLFVLVAPWLLLRRHWSAALAWSLTVAGALLLTLVLFGVEPFVSYASDNPVGRKPAWVYSIDENQSLLAEIIRRGGAVVPLAAMAQPPFLLAAGALAAATVLLVLLLGDSAADLAFALIIPAAVLVYPQSLEHYAVFLLPSLFVLWRDRAALPLSTLPSLALLTAVYAVVRYDQGRLVFYATLLTWAALALCGIRVIGGQAWRSRRSANIARSMAPASMGASKGSPRSSR